MLPADPTIPEGLEVLTAPDGSTVVRRRWRSWMLVLLAFFVLFWLWDIFRRVGGTVSPLADPWYATLLYVLSGVVLLYYFVAGYYNVTDVTVGGREVQVQSGPVPWFGNRTVPAATIRQVWVRERVVGRNVRSYRLMYTDADGQERRLLDALPTAAQAEYIAAVMRRGLRLAGEPAAHPAEGSVSAAP